MPTPLLAGYARPSLTVTEVRATPLTWFTPEGVYIEEAGPIASRSRSILILEVLTDQGLVGIGPGSPRDREAIARLVGQSPFDVEALALPPGLDIACWDLIGKALGQPVYRLLATDHAPNPRVKVYASAGVNWTFYDKGDGSPVGVEALIAEALRFKAMGFDTFKWRPGTDWEEAGLTARDLGEQVCRPLREAVGPDFKLGIEKKAWDCWTFEQCLEIAPIINELGFYFFEQPMMDLGPAQFDDYRTLKAAMPKVMLWGGEGLRSLEAARPWIEQGIYDAIQCDSTWVGLTENWRIARLAAEHGRKVVPHNWTSALGTMVNTHLVAGTPAGHMCEYFLYPNTPWRELFRQPHQGVNGVITLSDAPGFGVELRDLEELKGLYPYRPDAHDDILPNPRFPHASARARAREQAVIAHYTGKE